MKISKLTISQLPLPNGKTFKLSKPNIYEKPTTKQATKILKNTVTEPFEPLGILSGQAKAYYPNMNVSKITNAAK